MILEPGNWGRRTFAGLARHPRLTRDIISLGSLLAMFPDNAHILKKRSLPAGRFSL